MNPRDVRDLLTKLGLTVGLLGSGPFGCDRSVQVTNPVVNVDAPTDRKPEAGPDTFPDPIGIENPAWELVPESPPESPPEPIAIENPAWELVHETPAEPPADGGTDGGHE